jgi:probable rRNA maturation factor
VVDAATMRRLHNRYLKRATVTDVLSFEVARDSRGSVTEGEIVVCLPVAQSEAGRRGHSVEKELLLYALHGLLHLCGYDDATPAKAAQMHVTEDRVLQKIGVGPVFSPRKLPKRSPRLRNVAERPASS